MREGRG
jgi:hypothetical protein